MDRSPVSSAGGWPWASRGRASSVTSPQPQLASAPGPARQRQEAPVPHPASGPVRRPPIITWQQREGPTVGEGHSGTRRRPLGSAGRRQLRHGALLVPRHRAAARGSSSARCCRGRQC
jgi:hypothetical protein